MEASTISPLLNKLQKSFEDAGLDPTTVTLPDIDLDNNG